MLFIKRNIKIDGLKISDLTNPSNSVDFYKSKRVRKHLVLCYGLKCCYCEANIPSTAYFQVEHFYPKNPSSGLPAQFAGNTQIYQTDVINNIKNYHVACTRCNLLKSDFVGEALSPNFYHDGVQWKESYAAYIDANIKYKGALVECTPKYKDFCDKLKMNGETGSEVTGLHSSSLLDRTIYLEETKKLLYAIYKLCKKQEYEGAKDLFNLIKKRFIREAPYSKMIINNLGVSFLKIKNFLKTH